VERRWVHPCAGELSMGASQPEIQHVLAAYEALVDVDVVHDHTLIGPLHAQRAARAPVVTTNHGPFDAALLALYREVAPRVPVIAISQHQAGTATGVPIVRVIYHGLDVGAIPVGHGAGGYLLFLGRMVPGKGAHRAARAARAAGVPLLLAARMREPGEAAYFEQQVRPLLGGAIEYIGEVGVADKHRLLGDAVALVTPIRWPEPFGLAMIEALAAGTPVLAYRSGAAPEVVEHRTTGYLCDDEADLVRRIRDVERIDRRACRAAAETRFSMARMARDHLDVYAQLSPPPADQPRGSGSGRSASAPP
jgi:glycosyltransferase involved in cell wall biosynthesis